tara:strand:- start:10573 stop:11346 length:774 start_codon:yes stop_codon:yes gene_type:complete
MNDKAFTSLVKIWLPDKSPRVWSLLVTLFGDLAQAPNAQLSGAAVNAILNGIGIKSEAIRVALHRLRRDGWIESNKAGRKSNYSLTSWGRDQSAAANPTIYGPWPEISDAWLVAIDLNGHSTLDTQGMTPITTHLFINLTPVENDSAFVVHLSPSQAIPRWVSDRLCSSQLNAAAQDFLKCLERFQRELQNFDPLTPVQTAILRTLLVHEWRRIILKAPAVPDFIMPDEWVGAACKQLFPHVLAALTKPDLTVLNDL